MPTFCRLLIKTVVNLHFNYSCRWRISAPYVLVDMWIMTVKFPLTRTSQTVPAKLAYVFDLYVHAYIRKKIFNSFLFEAWEISRIPDKSVKMWNIVRAQSTLASPNHPNSSNITRYLLRQVAGLVGLLTLDLFLIWNSGDGVDVL